LFPADNPWRRDISHAPLSRNSAAWVRNIGRTAHLHPDFGSNASYGIPLEQVPADQRKVRIKFTVYGDESDPGPYPIPRSARVEAGSDRHVLVASANCHLYELYGAHRTSSGWAAASGAVFNLRSDRLRPDGWTSADAAGLPISAGLVRPSEIAAGHIDHAARLHPPGDPRGRFDLIGRRGADGRETAAQGLVLAAGLRRGGAHRPGLSEEVRHVRRRQRLELVHQRRELARLERQQPR
jgi:hypothetical protein